MSHVQHTQEDQALNARSHYLRGRALADLGLLQGARDDLEKAILLDPRYPDAHYQLGHVFQRLGQAAEAAQKFEQYVQLAPKAQDVAVVRARAQALRASA